MTIVGSRPQGDVIQLLLNVLPDLSILQVWVELDHLHALLFCGSQLVQVESDSVERGEYGEAHIEPESHILHQLVEEGLARVERVLFRSLECLLEALGRLRRGEVHCAVLGDDRTGVRGVRTVRVAATSYFFSGVALG